MLWVVCKRSKEYDWNKFEKINDIKIIDPSDISIKNINGNIDILINNQEVTYPKFCLFWLGCGTTELMKIINDTLILKKVKMINSMQEILMFSNKFHSAINFVQNDIKCINMQKLNIDNIERNKLQIENTLGYPLVLKSDVGSQGKGIYLARDYVELNNIIENIKLLDKKFTFHLEKYIDYQADIRMYIIYDEYVLFKRINDKIFKANYAQGSTFSVYNDNEDLKELFNKIKTTYDSNILAVDILLYEGDYYICEINSAPGFINFEKLLNKSFPQIIMEKING